MKPLSGAPRHVPIIFSLYIDSRSQADSGYVEAYTEAVVETPADVIIASLPQAMIAVPGAGATSSYVVKNTGGTATTVNVTQSGSFFTQSPNTFVLGPDATQIIAITALNVAAGTYDGSVTLSGTGVPANLTVPVKLLVANAPTGTPIAAPQQNRVDVRSPSGSNATGTASFTNTGNDTLTGILASDVPWIVPQSGVITIAPGQTVTVTFQIDDSKRPNVVGSLSGNLTLNYLAGGSSSSSRLQILSTSKTSSTPITIISTRPPQVANAAIPDLAPGEVALFLPGVGHVTGTVGVFLTDITLANIMAAGSLDGVKLFYSSPATSTTQVSTLQLTAGQPISLADTTKTVFNAEGQIGTLQVRSADVTQLSASAVVFNSSNPKGTYGSSIPVFRSDRSVAPGKQMYITGIRQTTGTHTNMYLQETGGSSARVVTESFDASGKSLGSRTDTVDRFALRQLGPVFPQGTVSAVITNAADSTGKIVGYVTPVDEGSGDTWAITDWSQQAGYSADERVVISNVGAVHGANATYFRSDLAAFNTSTGSSSATLRYYPRNGAPIDKSITLAPRQSFTSDDVVTTLFGLTTDSSGYIVLAPTAGSFSVTSRTYTTPPGQNATLGTAVPALAVSQSVGFGVLVRRMAGLEDASLNTIVAGRAATFRTNFAFVETAGAKATIRVTVTFTASAGAKTTSQVTASKVYTLEPYQFLPVSGLTRDVVGSERESAFGDLHNVEVDFQALSGQAIVYATSVDNGTGDSIMRVE